MPKNSSFKGFLPSTSFAMAVCKKRVKPQQGLINTISTPQSATTLFGRGNQKPELLFVGESFNEAACKLLDKMIEAMGVKVSEVFIAEIHAHAAFEKAAVDLHAPKLIVTLGDHASELLLGKEVSSAKKSGSLYQWAGYPVIASFSPEYLLKHPAAKKEAWDDLKFVMKHLKWKK